MYFAIFKSRTKRPTRLKFVHWSLHRRIISLWCFYILTRVIVVGLGTSALIRETNVKGGEVLWQKCSQTEMFLRAGIVLWQNWGECCPSRRAGQTPVVHATDPYYHLTYDHITPVARRLRFIGDKGSDKKAYPSNYPAGVQVVTSKWQSRPTWPVNTNSSAGEIRYSAQNKCLCKTTKVLVPWHIATASKFCPFTLWNFLDPFIDA